MSDTRLDGHRARRDDAGAPPIPAATVVPLRNGPAGLEILFLHRGPTTAFGGMWVFPGGKVDAGDAPAPREGDEAGVAGEIAVARRAAIREASEEAQLVFAPEDLVAHSFWFPPAEMSPPFATWFFLAPAASATIVVDRSEVHEHCWMTPAKAIAERDAGRLALAPPTWVTAWQLLDAGDVAAALAEAEGRPPLRFRSHLATDGERSAVLWEGDAGYEDGDLARPGPRRRLWVGETGAWRAESPHEAA